MKSKRRTKKKKGSSSATLLGCSDRGGDIDRREDVTKDKVHCMKSGK